MPKYAVISVGDTNYGHPTEDTLSRLRDADVKVYRTDMQGDIVATRRKTVTVTTKKRKRSNQPDRKMKNQPLFKALKCGKSRNLRIYRQCEYKEIPLSRLRSRVADEREKQGLLKLHP